MDARLKWTSVAPILLVTFLGTVNNNIVNVPMEAILGEFRSPLTQGSFVVVGWSLAIATLLPLGGWLGDRIGRRRLFLAAVAALGLSAIGAAFAGSLATLVVFRVLQGVASAAIMPTVMGLLTDIAGPANRAQVLGYWAAVNGLGQAAGAPLGGVLTQWLGWRSIFWPTAILGSVAFLATLRWVPRDTPRLSSLDRRGAALVTVGVALVLTSITLVPEVGIGSAPLVAALTAGLLLLAGYLATARRHPQPFVPPALLRDREYAGSSAAAAAQMFALGATLLAVPLYLTRADISPARAGLLVFALPAAMTVLAPVAGRATRRFAPFPTIRAGLAALAAAQAVLAALLAGRVAPAVPLVLLLVAAGAGVAFVQTPAATAATHAAGHVGTGLGVYNLVRFGGSTVGASWVALGLELTGSFSVVFAVAAAVVTAALVMTLVATRHRAPASSLPPLSVDTYDAVASPGSS